MDGSGMALAPLGVMLVPLGFLLHLAATMQRGREYAEGRVESDDPRYFRNLLTASVAGAVLALGGFLALANSPAHPGVDYGSTHLILAILAAGVTAGFFAFSVAGGGRGEADLANIISITYMALYYLLFGALSFYMGKSQEIHDAEGMTILGPFVLFGIMVVSVLFNFWDYRRAPKASSTD
jgi:hypothetical protein